jgi:hypothetical protein
MKLVQTQEALNAIVKRFGETLRYAVIDIKPQEWGYRNGYSYYGYSSQDTNTIYNSIAWLNEAVNDDEGPFYFDVQNHYIVEKIALEDLKKCKEQISNNYASLLQIEAGYKKGEASEYPLKTALSFYGLIDNLLIEILKSEEIFDFERPGEVKRLANENLDLYFQKDWSKYQLKCWIHFSSFWVYILVTFFMLYIKEENNYLFNNYKYFTIFFLGILTIIFNTAFNNYQTFKDAWKLVLSSSRKKLKAHRKQEFLKKKS